MLSGTKFTTDWATSAPNIHDGDSSLDWYYALSHFRYRLVGDKHGSKIVYHVEVQKRYDWGIPSEHRSDLSAGGGPLKLQFEQADIAHLNSTGLAQDFDVKGSSGQQKTHA